jgi:hypothetical protein
MGWLVLALLSAFALLDAAAIAARTKPRGRAELGIATALCFAALVGAPVLVLGYANVLWPWTLGPAALAEFAAVFALLARSGGPREVLSSARGSLAELARLPGTALREAFDARSLVFAGLVVVAGILVAALVLSYLIEFCRWDDEIYHVPIVGWALQLHGFAFVDAPPPGVGGTNGYPKLGEAFEIWSVIFTDKTLIDVPATLFAPPAMLALYGLARRFVDRVDAMGLAVVLLLVPHAWRQFCSSYVDMDLAFFLLAATYYASREEHTVRDTVMCTVAMALAAATKMTWLMFVPPIAFVAYVRRLRDRADPARAVRSDLLVVLASVLAVGVAGGVCVARNGWHYGNPVWPVTVDLPRLGLHWDGIFTPKDYRGHDPPVVEGFDVPHGGMHDVMRQGYGLAVMWVAGPLGVAAIAVWLLKLGRGALRRSFDDEVRSLAPIVLPWFFWMATGPNFGQARYNLHVVGAFLVGAAWLVRGAREARLRDGAVGAMLVLSIVPLFWLKDANPTTVEEEVERLSHPFATRAFSVHPSFDSLERQKYDELKAGDEVVFSEGVAFPGLLWNFELSNRVDYVAFTGGAAFTAKLEELRAKWVCVGGGSGARKTLESSGKWELIGRTNPALNELAFRRKGTGGPS